MSPVTFWFSWFWKALWTMPEFLGSNWIGAVFAFACAFFYERRKFLALDKFKEVTTLRDKLRVLGGFLMDHWQSTVRLWLCILGAFLIGHALDLVYRHNDSLASQNMGLNATISTNSSTCEKEKTDLRIFEAKDQSRADTLSNQNRDQQNTIDTCLLQQKEIPKARTYTILREVRPGVPKMEYMLTTNVETTPARFVINCDMPIADTSVFSMTETGASTGTVGKNRVAANSIKIDMESPAWSPISPLWVTVFFTPPVNAMPRCLFVGD